MKNYQNFIKIGELYKLEDPMNSSWYISNNTNEMFKTNHMITNSFTKNCISLCKDTIMVLNCKNNIKCIEFLFTKKKIWLSVMSYYDFNKDWIQIQ